MIQYPFQMERVYYLAEALWPKLQTRNAPEIKVSLLLIQFHLPKSPMDWLIDYQMSKNISYKAINALIMTNNDFLSRIALAHNILPFPARLLTDVSYSAVS